MVQGQAAPYEQFVPKFLRNLAEFLRRRPDVGFESLQHSTEEMTLDLGTARNNAVIHDRFGDRLFILSVTGLAYIRFNNISNPQYQLRLGSISLPFTKVFLTNTAQEGKKVKFIIGYEAFIDFATAIATKLQNTSDLEIDPSTLDLQQLLLSHSDANTQSIIDAICGVEPVISLDDLLAALEELPEKVEIQPAAFDQKTAVTVTDSPTLILALNTARKGFFIRHYGDDEIGIGNSSVSFANGLPFYPGDVLNESHLPVTAAIYGITESGTQEMRVVEEV